MQRSNPNIFHVAKVHRICHGLVIHPLHCLAAGKEDEIKNNFVIGYLFQNHSSNTTLELPCIKIIMSNLCLKSLSNTSD